MLALVAGFLALQAGAGGGADWWYVVMSGEPGEMQAHYADRASIRRSGDHVTISEGREGETPDEQGIIASRMLMEYDCRARTGRIVTYVFIGAGDRVLGQGDAGETLHPMSPGSVYDSTMDFACGRAEGLEQLDQLGLREHALLLFRDYIEHLAARPEGSN